MSTPQPSCTALIAEDEPLLAAALRAELQRAWPALQVLATAGDGGTAVQQALTLQPDVLFFDIRMPGMGGLEAVAEIADLWRTDTKPFPALVFVTAYDQYALQAFEAQAVDYLLKPVHPARLQKTVAKLQATLALRSRQDITRSQWTRRPTADFSTPPWLSCASCWRRPADPGRVGAAGG
jgi:DNA-binding LytR/AlgR family response regulator